jgi:hypothetical protein
MVVSLAHWAFALPVSSSVRQGSFLFLAKLGRNDYALSIQHSRIPSRAVLGRDTSCFIGLSVRCIPLCGRSLLPSMIYWASMPPSSRIAGGSIMPRRRRQHYAPGPRNHVHSVDALKSFISISSTCSNGYDMVRSSPANHFILTATADTERMSKCTDGPRNFSPQLCRKKKA